MPGLVRTPRRPPGFRPVGPTPPGASAGVLPGEDEDVCALAGEWGLFQKRRGHRWSLDDLVVAHVAAEEAKGPRACLDLGCGIGSVLLMTAWRFPEARCVGIEAQEVSVGLARKSIAWNGAEGRVEVRHGDLRDALLLPEGAAFELVTGTPPYFPIGDGTLSPREQAPFCRFEHRGGVEDYCAAAARALAPGGVFVVVGGARQDERIREGASAAGLQLSRWVEVIPRAGKDALIWVAALRREPGPVREETLTVRGADGQWTPEFRRVREAMGMPSRPR